jgi:hypothetical protein
MILAVSNLSALFTFSTLVLFSIAALIAADFYSGVMSFYSSACFFVASAFDFSSASFLAFALAFFA